VNLPLSTKGVFITPDGKTVDAAGLPVPAPPKPDLSTRPCDVCGADYPRGVICPPCRFKAAAPKVTNV